MGAELNFKSDGPKEKIQFFGFGGGGGGWGLALDIPLSEIK